MSTPAPRSEECVPDGADVREGAIIRKLDICNRKGLHARASAKFVQTVEKFDADVRVMRCGETVGGTSIMGLMMLAAGPGSTLHLRAQGPQGPEALQALIALVEAGFDEDCIEDA